MNKIFIICKIESSTGLHFRELTLVNLRNSGIYKNDKTWNNFGYIIFLQLRPNYNVQSVEARLNDIMNKSRENNTAKISLEPLQDMYFEADLQSSGMPYDNENYLYI